MQAACGLPSGDSGTEKLITALIEAIGLVDWKTLKGDPEGSVLDLLVECIDSAAEWFRPGVIEGINVDL